MRVTILSFFFVIVLCFLTERALASYCYPNYCQNLTHLVPIPGFRCVLTRVDHGKDCAKLKFDEADKKSSKQDNAIFALYAYMKNFEVQQKKATAFNISISDINFHSLTIRYQNIANENENACRYVELYGNATHPAPKELYVSCPFSDATYEGSPYRLEYLMIGENFVYSKKYIFYVPQHKFIEDGVRVENFTPFMYIDLSDLSNLAVYVQSLPSTYNVTEYKVWLINNGTKSVSIAIISTNKNNGLIRYNFSAPDGVYYVKVAALHPKCGKHGCANSTSPYICIKHASDRLLIMIISLIWIPPVLLYALYHAFKLYRKKVLKRIAIRPNCLLVYSPTHPAHVNVMAELTKYLKCCNINVMIDMFDIPETTSKDPGLWCNIAFQAADVVLIVTSPPMSSAKSDTTIIYRNVDNHLLRLLKENYPQRNKRYYAIYLPYCKSDHIPEEARLFKKFRLPENLTKLVKTIHGIGCLRFLTASDTELLESIRCAMIKIFENEASSTPMKNTDETAGLLSSIIKNEKVQDIKIDRSNEVHKLDTPDGDVIPQSFTTNIDELNLLGEVSEEKNLDFNFTRNDCEFHIDKLNL
ncbi:SEFIR domain-containing protein [Camponotus japonicus]